MSKISSITRKFFSLVINNKSFVVIFIIIISIFLIRIDSIYTVDQLNLHYKYKNSDNSVAPLNQQSISTTNTLATISIDYNNILRTLSPLAIGGVDESGYGTPNVLVNDSIQQQKLKQLGIPYMRMSLKYTLSGDPSSRIVCGGEGCDTRWSGDQWINSIKNLNAIPVVNDPVNPSDLPALVKHFNKDTNNHITRWLSSSNEPDLSGIDATTYSNNFNQLYDAMKAIDPTIKIGGPTVAWYDAAFLQIFLNISGTRVDFIDFHAYPQGLTIQPYDELFLQAAKYESNILDLFQRIKITIPMRANQIEIQVGEWDLNYVGHLSEYTPFNIAWGASTLGHIINAGGIGLLYADKGNLLFMNGNEIPGAKIDDTTPMYHALGMFTGEGIFPKFGSRLVLSTTSLTNIEVYASDSPKNIVIINKDSHLSQKATIFLNTISSGTVQSWRNDPTSLLIGGPSNNATLLINQGFFTVDLPALSVTTLVITPYISTPNPLQPSNLVTS